MSCICISYQHGQASADDLAASDRSTITQILVLPQTSIFADTEARFT
jgi:hypothetical protein